MELTQSVGSLTFLMAPLFFLCQSTCCFFTLLRNVADIILGGLMTGVTELSVLIVYGLSKHLNPENILDIVLSVYPTCMYCCCLQLRQL